MPPILGHDGSVGGAMARPLVHGPHGRDPTPDGAAPFAKLKRACGHLQSAVLTRGWGHGAFVLATFGQAKGTPPSSTSP